MLVQIPFGLNKQARRRPNRLQFSKLFECQLVSNPNGHSYMESLDFAFDIENPIKLRQSSLFINRVH